MARAGGTRYIFARPGLASCRRRPLSSNVMPQSQTPVSCIHLEIRRALPEDAPSCEHMLELRRENAISPERVRHYGITEQSWAEDIRTDAFPGSVCHSKSKLLGYPFGARASGEVVVLALLPQAESQGLGSRLLTLLVQELLASGHTQLFLGYLPDTSSRSYGFYRHLGWQSTGTFDRAGDEILEHLSPAALPAVPGGA